MFPAIREAWTEFRQGLGSQPEPLSLKESAVQAEGRGAEWYARNGYYDLYRQITGGMEGTWSGENVSIDSAQTHSVVWACERIISESIGMMPLNMMQETDKGKFPVKTKPMHRALKRAPNPEMTAMSMRETMTAHCVMGGNCFAQIFRQSGTGEAYELYPIPPDQVKIDREKTGQKRLTYVVKDGNSAEKTYTVDRARPHDILHVPGLSDDGINGYSVISKARQSIGTAQSAERYAAKFYASGGRPPYHIEWDKKFKSDEDFDKWAVAWRASYGSPDGFHKAPITEPGMKLVQDGLSPEDSQFLETRQFGVPEICRWFLISPHMVGDLTHGTFSNIENLYEQYLKGTLSGWITRWEQNLWRCILTNNEKSAGFYFNHNVNGLLRAAFETRMKGHATALANGFKTINEVRDLEDYNPLPSGGDVARVQLAMAPLDLVDNPPEPTVAAPAAKPKAA